jgi:AraC-like DNA-binding protein
MERVVPSGTVELVINMHDEALRVSQQLGGRLQAFRTSIVSGPQSQFFDGEIPTDPAVVGVHFKPGGAYPFLSLPATVLLNSFVSLDMLYGDPGMDLRDRLLETSNPSGQFRIIEQFLLMRMKRSLPSNPGVKFALNQLQVSKPRPIAEIANRIGISPRHFIKVFAEEVGVTPKMFSRIQRFQRVVKQAERLRTVEWEDLCLASGYYDQAHLIHDFREFSGYAPTEYLKRKTGRPNHVSLS